MQYAKSGISTDHECATLDEGRDCIRAGMKVIIREGSAAKDYAALHLLLDEYPDQVMLCTDDCHADDLVRGHINGIVKRALRDGHDLWNVLQAACVNPQRHYGVNWGLLQKGGPATFIVVNNLGPHLMMQNTIIRGAEAYGYNLSFGSISARRQTIADLSYYPNRFCATPLTVEDIRLDIRRGDIKHIIHATDDVIVRAINRVIEMQGGQVAIADEEMTEMALPIAGLMSPLDGHEVAYRCCLLSDMAALTGCTMKAPFITMAFLCLPVIPELKITDKFLWDSKKIERIT